MNRAIARLTMPGPLFAIRGRAQAAAWRACLCLLVLTLTTAQAAPLIRRVTDYWGIEHGLPQLVVTAMAQDSTGFIWVGTQDGLARFDGLRFRRVGAPGSARPLPGQWIQALANGAAGDVWIATPQGVAAFRKGELETLPLPAGLDVLALAAVAPGDLLLLARGGHLLRWREGAGLQDLAQLPAPVSSLRVDALGNAWVGGVGVVWRIPDAARMLDGAAQEPEPLAARGRHPPQALALPPSHADTAVLSLAEHGGRLLAGSARGVFALEADGWQGLQHDPVLAGSAIHAMASEGAGTLWIASEEHLGRGDRELRMQWTHANTGALKPRSVFVDREGSLWFGQLRSGGLARSWDGWIQRYSQAEGLHDPLLWSLAADSGGGLWVGTDSGLSRLREGRFERVLDGTALPRPNVLSLAVQGERLWIGTAGGVAHWHAGQLQIPAQPPELSAAQVSGLWVQQQQLWIASSNGVFRGGAEGIEAVSGPRARYRGLLWLPDGSLLGASSAGLMRLGPDGFERVIEPGLPDPLDASSVHALDDGRLLLATLADGILLREDGRWHRLSRDNALPHVRAGQMMRSPGGRLWFATLRGVFQVDIAAIEAARAGEPVRIGNEFMLGAQEVRRTGQRGYCCNLAGANAGVMDARGQLWLATRDGVLRIDTALAESSIARPQPVIESVSFEGGRLVPGAGLLRLPPGQRAPSIELTALWLRDPDALHLQYRLLDVEPGWQALDDLRRGRVDYRSLPAGRYRFELRAAGGAGPWSEPLGLELELPPHFSETGMFRLLIALLCVGSVWAGFDLQRRRHRDQRLRLEQLVAERTEALAASHRLLVEASQADPATGVRNQRFLHHQLPADLAFYEREAARYAGCGLVFLLLPLNAADSPRAAATIDRIAAGLRRCDYVLRWQGQHVLLVSRPLPAQAFAAFCQRLHGRLLQLAAEAAEPAQAAGPIVLGACLHTLSVDAGRHWEASIRITEHALALAIAEGKSWVGLQPLPAVDPGAALQALDADRETALRGGNLLCLRGRRPTPPAART